MPSRFQRAEVRGAELARHDPDRGLDVPQAAWRSLQVGLEAVFLVVVLPVPARLLVALGLEKRFRGPQPTRFHQLVERGDERRRAHQVAALEQRGGHGQIVFRFLLAVAQRAHAVADLELEIEQAVHECRDLGLVRGGAARDDEQVDIGMREQLAAAVSAHREDGDFVADVGWNLGGPDLRDQAVEKRRTAPDQAVDVGIAPVLLGELGVEGVDSAAQVVDQGAGPVTEAACGNAGIGLRARSGHAKCSSLRRVSTSAPLAVTRIVCSHCADSLWSRVTTVHWSGRIFTWRAPALIIGSMVKVMPSSIC
jgi:hypothetical protein